MPEALLEAKGPGYKSFVKESDFVSWFRNRPQLMAQAERQSRIARVHNVSVEWHVAEPEVARMLCRLFSLEDINNIRVIHTPIKP